MLIITGTMGAGKTTVMAAASDILALRQIAHASIDLDALGCAHLPSKTSNDDVMYRNLQSVWNNYASIRLTRLLLARAIESRLELERCRAAISPGNLVICRLSASVETMQQRVQARETGISQAQFVARVQQLNVLLDRAKLEDFVVTNENRPVTEVAREMLVRAGWIEE